MAKKSRILLTGIFIAGGLTLIAGVSYKALKEASRNRNIEKEIQVLQAKAEKIRKDNKSLSEKISYLETDEFQEIEAKEKLNFQKKDEKVVVVRPSPSQDTEEENKKEEKKDIETEEDFDNYKKWWNFFFKY